jgi:hypothetical protein
MRFVPTEHLLGRFYIPFTNNGGFVDLTELTILSAPINNTPLILTFNQQIRDNGFKYKLDCQILWR